MKTQRLRLRYELSGPASTSGHRDLLRDWERAAAEAGIGLSYSQGKRPVAQISVAALLPQGVTSSGDLMDMFVDEHLDPRVVKEKLQRHLPPGVSLLEVEEVGLHTRSIQSQLRWADYEVEVSTDGATMASLQDVIDRLLASQTWPAEYRREAKVRRYDLRPLVLDIRIEAMSEGCVLLSMSLRAEPERTARADQVVRALDLPEPKRIHRTALHLQRTSAAVVAYRRGEGQ